MKTETLQRNPSPKRRRFKDNPYTIFTVGPEESRRYFISFIDTFEQDVCMEIDKPLFEAFDQFERDDLSVMNEFDRHRERWELTDLSLWCRAVKKSESMENRVVQTVWVQDAMNKLTHDQRRRLCAYYYYGYNYTEIAAMEKCSMASVAHCVKTAKRKMKLALMQN